MSRNYHVRSHLPDGHGRDDRDRGHGHVCDWHDPPLNLQHLQHSQFWQKSRQAQHFINIELQRQEGPNAYK